MRSSQATIRGALLALGGTLACSSAEPAPVPLLPKAPVEILVDARGVPHIYAQDDEDLFFGYGYQLASDRLLQLEMFRRFAHGRLSEVLGADGPGSAGASALIDDRFARIFDWKRWGKLDAERMRAEEPEHYRLTSAWVAGINQRIAEVHRGTVPRPFGFGPGELDFPQGWLPELWHPDDVYIVQKMAGFGLDQTIQGEVFVTFARRFAPQAMEAIELLRPAHPVFALPQEERPGQSAALEAPWRPAQCGDGSGLAPGALGRLSRMKALGSNNWAVDGRHTASGMPLLAGDPHLGYDFSGITYALHLSSKHAAGSFDAIGFSFVGAPGIFAGHNDRVAWSPTSAFADVMDMWGVEIADGKARIGEAWIDTVTRTEVIPVRGAEPDVIEVVEVPGYGVVMPASLVGSPIAIAEAGREVLVGWTGFAARPARSFRELMRVQSLDELDAAVLRMPEMTYNFVGADAQGISYRVGVEVPRRHAITAGREPFAVMDGGDPDAFWPADRLGPDELPHSRALERGWIATANNDPFGFTENGRVDDDPFYYGALFPPHWRAKRIEEELARLVARGGVTLEDMQRLQMDVRSNLADDLLPVVEQAWQSAASDPTLAELRARPDLAELVALLSGWDRRMARDSAAAVVFHALAHFVTAGVLEDDLNPILFEIVLTEAPMYLLKVASMALRGAYASGDVIMQEGRDRLVLEALAETSAFLEQRFGSIDAAAYSYADVRVSSMDHAFGRGVELGVVPTDGGESTVNVAQSVFREGGEALEQWVSHWGPIERQVTTFESDGTPVAYANFALGNVADRQSPHFDDAMDDWLAGRYEKLLFARDEIEAAAETRIVLPAAR